MQQQSNTYIILFSVVTTIIFGGLLSFANQGLKSKQQKSIELDTKRQILTAVTDLKGKKGKEILDFYDNTIQSIVIDIDGNPVEKDEEGKPIVAEKVNIGKNYKKPFEKRQYPVFIFHKEGDSKAVESYIIPVYGKGLWGPIWGYVALDTDMNTIKGVSFDHKTETPGLGARITTPEITDRYKGKKIFDEKGDLISVNMLKGEKNSKELIDTYHVDGMSGATLTAKGLNEMLESYFKYYSKFLKKSEKQVEGVASL